REPPLPRRQRGYAPYRLPGCRSAVRAAVPRRRAPPHRGGAAAGALLQCYEDGADGAGHGRAGYGVGPMSRSYNVGGLRGGIGRSHIVEGYLPNADKFKVVAICDLNPERLNKIGEEFGIERRVANFDDLLAMDDIDVIDVCTPPGVHFSMVMAALKAGKHV